MCREESTNTDKELQMLNVYRSTNVSDVVERGTGAFAERDSCFPVCLERGRVSSGVESVTLPYGDGNTRTPCKGNAYDIRLMIGDIRPSASRCHQVCWYMIVLQRFTS